MNTESGQEMRVTGPALNAESQEVAMSAGRICSRVLVTAAPGESVTAAAGRMAEYDVGTVVVVEGEPGAPVGIVTDRDIVIRGVAAGLDLTQTPVSQLMTTPVRTVDEATPIEQALGSMAASATRRLVVVDPTGARSAS